MPGSTHCKTLHILGRIYRADKRVEDTRKTLERALALLDENGDVRRELRITSVLMYLSEIHSILEENLVAESLLRRCVAVCEGRENGMLIYAIALNNLGRL